MTDPGAADGAGALPALAEVVRIRLEAGLPVRRSLAGGGRLHIDRPLPFLCVHRVPDEAPDRGAAALVRTQASYLVAPASPEHHQEVSELVRAVTGALVAQCGACLLLELWLSTETNRDANRTAPRPFRVVTSGAQALATTAEALCRALSDMKLPVPYAVELCREADMGRRSLPALLPDESMREGGCLALGLEVPPIHRSPEGQFYPFVHRVLARELTNALQRAFLEFTRVQTPARPDHHHLLGRRRLVRAVKQADRELVRIGRSFDFLLDVTPVNTQSAWEEFCSNGRKQMPAFHYRMLAVDPDLARRDLYQLPLERLEDPVLASLLHAKRRELDDQLSMVEDRDSERFLAGSLRLYGGVEDTLYQQAEAILAADRPAAAAASERAPCDAQELMRRARLEIEHYRRAHPALSATVQLRDDVASLMVSHGDLLVPRNLTVAAGRVEPLLQHEVGTHLVTQANGRAQALQVFAEGLAGYEALQEGLAVFAEYMAGGFDVARLRLVAARVVAVRRLLVGSSFPRLVEELSDGHALPARTAFTVAMRVFRGGGLTKDAIYLRGLVRLLSHLAGGGAMEPLLVGKVSFEHLPLVEELLRREVIAPPALLPRWLNGHVARDRLQRARAGLHPTDLVERGAQA